MPPRLLVPPIVLLALAACAPAAREAAPTRHPASADGAAQVTALADEFVAAYVAAAPEQAEQWGFPLERHDGLSDNSLAAVRAWQAREDAWAARLARIDGAALRGRPEWVTYGMLRERIDASRAARVCRGELWPVSQMSGWQVDFATIARLQPVGTPALRQQALARWRRVPAYLENEIANLREGMRLGYTTPRRNVELVMEQLDALLAMQVEQSPFFSPAQRDSADGFRAAWAALLRDQLMPAAARYRAFLANEYRPAAREAVGVGALPQGRACYQASFRLYTTLDRAPEETYSLGQARVARNQAEVVEIGRRAWGTGEMDSIRARVRAAPGFATRDQMLAFANDALVRGKAAVPLAFRATPAAPVVIEAHPAFLEATASDQYFPAAEDGSRPAQYRINLGKFTSTTRAQAEITAFHETYPGHHLQIALAQEAAAHPVARLTSSGSYLEGWARYAEALAEEMGLYTSDEARVGRRLWPARGMVIDPGIHLFGWTRQQAVDYILVSGRMGPHEAAALVDRVVAWPGQLTAYDTGALEFFALRQQAERELGSRFDLREFHDVLLRHGAVTLPMLRESVAAWIAEQRGR